MPLRLLRVLNPVVLAVLRSPAHRLLSGALCILSYAGPRSGRTYSIPVMYARTATDVVVLAAVPERKRWWRAFQAAAPATLTIRRQVIPVTGRLLDRDDRRTGLRAYLDRFPRAARTLRVTVGAGDADLDGVDAALVGFAPRLEPERATSV